METCYTVRIQLHWSPEGNGWGTLDHTFIFDEFPLYEQLDKAAKKELGEAYKHPFLQEIIQAIEEPRILHENDDMVFSLTLPGATISFRKRIIH